MQTGGPVTLPTLGRVQNLDFALDKHGDRVGPYIDAMLRTDPLADAFAEDCSRLGVSAGMRMLNQAVVARVPVPDIPGAPRSLADLIDHVETVPEWVDLDLIDKGAAAYSRQAREAGIALGTASLVSGYYNAAASRPLIITGRFRDLARLRALETSMWVFAVSRPGGPHRDGDGFRRTARVRMVHAFVRQHIRRRVSDWDDHELGAPINQADLAYTVVEFSYLPIRSMQRLGVHFNRGDLDAMYAMWRYMGYLMGVDDSVLPTSEAECADLNDLYHVLSPPPNDDCRAFVKALMDDVLSVDVANASGFLGLVTRKWGRDLMHGLSRNFVGDSIADGLAIEDTYWKYVPYVTAPVLGLATRLRYVLPGLQTRQMNNNLNEIDVVLAQTAAELNITHDLVDRAPTGHPASVSVSG